MLAEEAYYSRPIALRHPIVFYEGHLPGFSFNTLIKKGLGLPSIDGRLRSIRAGIDRTRHRPAGQAGQAGRAARMRGPRGTRSMPSPTKRTGR